MNDHRRQRGSIGLFGTLSLLLALIFTALAVDTGRLWFERRQLQTVADVAALEAAHHLGCGVNTADVAAAAQAAAVRNQFAGDLGTSPNLVEIGGITTQNGLRVFQAGAASDAVHVVATLSVPASLVLGGFFGNNTLISAQATARAEPSHATFSAGSYALRVSTTGSDATLLNSLLGGLLGGSLSLNALSYQGLASTDITLGQLVRADGSVGSVEQLLSTNMTVLDLINLTSSALAQQGPVDASVSAGLQQLAHASVRQANIQLGSVLDVSVPASDAAAKVGINVLDLVTAAIMAAHQNYLVAVAVPPVNLGGVINIGASVNAIQPPVIAVGPPGKNAAGQWCAQARTAQVTVTASVHANVLALLTIDLGLNARVAQGEAHLESLAVASGSTQATIGATPGIASIYLTGSNGNGLATVALAGLTVANIGLNLPVQPGSATDLIYHVGYPLSSSLPQQQSVSSSIGGSLASALSNPNTIQVKVLPDLPLLTQLALNPLLSPLLNTVLAPLLGDIGSALLDPLFRVLGLQLGGLEVGLEDIQYTGNSELVI